MDVASDAEIDAAFAEPKKHWAHLDIVVHSVGFAPREQLAGSYIDSVTREGFRIAHDISAYSLAALAKAARPMMQGRNGSILTLSYLGAVRAIPNYNVMGPAKASLEANVRFLAYSLGPEGTRVNGISAGPIKTLAAAGISGFRDILKHVEDQTPLRKNVTHRGRGQRCGLPVFGSGRGYHRRDPVRGCWLQPRGHESQMSFTTSEIRKGPLSAGLFVSARTDHGLTGRTDPGSWC